MRARLRRLLLGGLVVLAAACSGDGTLEVTAVFEDVGDLVPRAGVTVSDVQVGAVVRIERTPDQHALVHLRVDADAALPADVRARLRRTSLLGERFVELVPQGSGALLADGDRIAEAVVVPDLEEALLHGGDIVAAVTADRLATGLEGAAAALGGRGQTLRGLLDDLGLVAGAYADRSDDLIAIIDDVDAFLADIAPEAALHGEALRELRVAAATFSDQDERLYDALEALQELSVSGTGLLVDHRADLDATLRSLQGLTAEVEARDADLARLFGLLAVHNDISIRGVNAENIQVFADVIVCGHNEDPGDPVRSCRNPPQGTTRPEPGGPR